jgi:glycosyltransferase involved in cell wall biosynthesis
MDNKITVLWIGDGAVATGFAAVNHNIIENLPPDDYDIHHLAVNHRGDYYPTKSWHKLYPAMLGGDLLGFSRIPTMLEKVKPDIIFILNDLWVIKDYLRQIDHDIPIVLYFPVDAGPVQPAWVEKFPRVEGIVAYTQYGRSEVLRARPDLEVLIIPHGINTEQFFPIDMTEARVVHMQGTINPNDWIVLNANRNQPRKRVDLTIKGFCEFARDKPDTVRLYLHMGLEDAGWRIDTMMERYGHDTRLYITSPNLRPDNCVPVEVLNYIYNSCNVGLNTSLGEGWGLVPFEHGATGAVQIMPANSANIEIWGDGRGLLMPVEDETITTPRILTEGSVPSVHTIANSLQYAYDHPKEMQDMADAAYEWMMQPGLKWENIALQWDALFKRILNKRNKQYDVVME